MKREHYSKEYIYYSKEYIENALKLIENTKSTDDLADYIMEEARELNLERERNIIKRIANYLKHPILWKIMHIVVSFLYVLAVMNTVLPLFFMTNESRNTSALLRTSQYSRRSPLYSPVEPKSSRSGLLSFIIIAPLIFLYILYMLMYKRWIAGLHGKRFRCLKCKSIFIHPRMDKLKDPDASSIIHHYESLIEIYNTRVPHHNKDLTSGILLSIMNYRGVAITCPKCKSHLVVGNSNDDIVNVF